MGEGGERLRLQDCQGGRLAVHGARKASLMVTDRDGTEAELEYKLVIGGVKTCILSLGELCRNPQRWQRYEMYLESLDCTLQVPVMYECLFKLEFYELKQLMRTIHT